MKKTLGYGKHRDTPLDEIPEDYLEWLIRSSQETINLAKAELERRELADLADGTWKERLLKAGLRSLMKQHHPDAGGTTADAQQVNAAYEYLRKFTK